MVLFCAWWLGVSADGMGRKVLSDMNWVSPVLFETGFWDLMIYISGPSGPLLPSFPSLWHDLRMSGKGRHLVPIWDKL